MEQREFLKVIGTVRCRMVLGEFLKNSVFAISIGARVGILFQLISLFVPFYYANLYMILALFLSLAPVLVVTYIRRPTMEQTALRIDCFGFEERIVTAYERLGKEGTLLTIQREDALKQLREHKDRIQIPLLPPLKRVLMLLFLLVLLPAASLLPSPAKDRAKELHSLKEEVREKEAEIEELMEALEELEQEELTTKQQEMLHEMMESLESSLSEYQQVVSKEALEAASQKFDYKYENMSDKLSEILQDLEDGAGVSVASAEAMQEMEELQKKMNGKKPGQGENDENGQGDADGDGQNGQGGGAGNGQNGQGAGNGQDGQNGQGAGNGQGADGGYGNGAGFGSSGKPHDYVSVPNEIADNGNLTGNAGNHDTSQLFRAQNGLNWEGEHISYEAVIGSYEQNAYEGIAADKYPSGMEDIIKEYFASFNSREQ